MVELYFLTSNPVKLNHARHAARPFDVAIKKQDYYGAAYFEPRIEERNELIQASLKDAIRRMARVPLNPLETNERELFEKNRFDELYYDSFFFIEDTSVTVHALSSQDKEVPGTDIKYWMKETRFEQLNAELQKAGNDRRVTIRSDVCLHVPEIERLKLGLEDPFILFTGESIGRITDREYEFHTNPVFPWLDNVSFNKWFVPDGYECPISMLPIEKADVVDFRYKSIQSMLRWLHANGLIQKQLASTVSSKRQAFFPFVKNHLLLVSGYPCSGKTTIGTRLSLCNGFHHIEASDFMRHAYHQLHGYNPPVKLEHFATEMLKVYPETVVNGVLAEIEKSGIPNVVITGFRSPEETRLFAERYAGSSDIQAVFLKADVQTRFERSQKRDREDALATLTEFGQRDDVQRSMGLAAIEQISSFSVSNNDSLDTFYRNFTDTFCLEEFPFDPEKACVINRFERTLEGRILLFFLIDELSSGAKKSYTTTEISNGINRVFTANRFQTEKDNVSRYFNFKSHPYFRANSDNNTVRFSLSATGRSQAIFLAKQKA